MPEPTSHFNGLTEAETERLAILSEECGEIVKAVGKIQRHGYESTNPTDLSAQRETNRQALERELGDLSCICQMMATSGDIKVVEVSRHASLKPARIKPYLHHQGGDNA